ncbi:MAG: GNAT family N-acetyltransferase [Alphaproteobacteria bacterium]|nr:GNAT family N-acetyltransferase [Alphaproteobacteria bacterium]
MTAAPHPALRMWRETDLPHFQALHADPDVARWLGGPLDAAVAEGLFRFYVETIERQGWGMWAVQDEAGALVGAAGLQPVRAGLPSAPGLEASWRLLPRARGRGLVTQSMRAVLKDAFARLDAEEIVTFTAAVNLRSQAVMQRLGFVRDAARDFDHPALPQGHELRRHVFFFTQRRDWVD